MSKINAQYALILSSIFCSAPAWAEEQQDNLIIVTATGAEQNIHETGQVISILSEADILGQQDVSVADLLSTLPGVNITQSGGIGTQTSVRIRGAESDQTLVLINGIRVNDPSSPDGSFDFGNLLAGNIERIELLRGANSVAWGSQALGGVVNITTKQPTEDIAVAAQSEYGAHDLVRTFANGSGRVGPLGISIGGGYVRTDGISAFSGGTELDGYRQYAGNISSFLEIAENIRVEANGYYANSRIDNDTVFPPFSGDNEQYSLAEETYGNIAIAADAFDGRFKNRFAYNIADINRQIINPFFTSLPKGRTERFEYRGDFAVAEPLRLVFGSEIENSHYRNQDVADKTGIDSAYIQAIINPFTGLTLTGGFRRDEHEDFGGNSSFAANIAYDIASSGTTLRASYGEGFRAPSLIDLDDRENGFGTPDLVPETAKSYEIGVDQDVADGILQFSITAFLRNTDNQIAFAACPVAPDPAPAVCTAGLRPFGTTLNIELTRTKGVETSLIIRPSERFTVSANYTYLDAENRSSCNNFGNELARRPSQSLYFNVDYQTEFGLKLSGDIQMIGDSFDDLANSRRIDGYQLVGIRSSLPITDAIELFGRIDNLFDVSYETATDFGTLGRSAYVGARLRF